MQYSLHRQEDQKAVKGFPDYNLDVVLLELHDKYFGHKLHIVYHVIRARPCSHLNITVHPHLLHKVLFVLDGSYRKSTFPLMLYNRIS